MAIKRVWSAGTCVLPALAAAMLIACRSEQGEIRVLTDRTESNLAPMFAAYSKATGTAIKAVYLDQGLVSRLESRPTESDVVITRDADLLVIAKEKGLLQPFASRRIELAVPPEHRDPEGMFFSDSYRARVIFYSRERVTPADLSTYEDLGSDRWRGRVCIRSGYHDYNLSLFGQMLVDTGTERTRAFLEKLAANLARTPTGNDRDQMRAIFEGRCDVAIANSYYMGIMLGSPDQRDWGLATRVFFPSQSDCGTYILRSGLALTKATANVQAARALLEYLVEDDTQAYMSKLTYAYPVKRGLPVPDVNRRLGEGQPGVREGAFKICPVPLEAVAHQRETVIRMLDEIRFDQPR